MTNAIKVIVLDDGNRGNLNQARGIAERLPGVEIEQITIPPLSFLCRAILILNANLVNITPLFKIRFILRHVARVAPPFFSSKPMAIISAGSKLASINILLSRCLSTKSIHVLYPDLIRLKLFDLLVTLEPDLWRHPWIAGAKNLMFIKGAPNRIKPADSNNMSFPRAAGQASPPRRVSGNPIRIAVLIGGDDKNYLISEEWAEELSRRLTEISKQLSAKIYLTTSRRTNRKVESVFQKFLGGKPERFNVVLYGHDFANPVAEFLSVADLIITTEDSINMVSESASSGKPTIVLKVERKQQKYLVFDRALENLVAESYIQLWSLKEFVSSNVSQAILNPNRKVLAETEKVAAKVLELLGNQEMTAVLSR